MPDNGLRVVARIKAREDKIEEVRRVLTGLIEPSRRENGCLVYELLQNSEDPTDFTFVEEWTGQEALNNHFQTEHFKTAGPQLADLVAEAPDIRTYHVIG